MNTIISLLKSIDTWTIIGSVAAVVCAIFAYFAIPRRPTAARQRKAEIVDLLHSVELQADDLLVYFREESAAWNEFGRRQAPGWKPSTEGFERALAKTRTRYVQLRDVLGRAAHQPDKENFGGLQIPLEDVAKSADMLMSGRCRDTDLEAAVGRLRAKRLSLTA